MTDETAWGGFENDGWWLHQPGDDVRSTQFASAHESHHKQLQDSTSHGAVAHVYFELGASTGEARFTQLARSLTAASRDVQESFASWLPAAALGWVRGELVDRYPAYVGYFDAIDRVVGGISSPYLRFHAAHAVARACMQTTIISSVLEVGLDGFTLAQLRARDLPDMRFAALRRRPPSWSATEARLRGESHVDEDLRYLLSAVELTADLFDSRFEGVWQRANLAMYDTVVDTLRPHGFPSIQLDEHLEQIPALIAAAAVRVDGALTIEAGQRQRHSDSAGTLLRNAEAETFIVAEPLPARVLPGGTDPLSLVADLVRPHLFVTVRPTAALFANYAFADGTEPPNRPAGAFARRTVIEPDGKRVVNLLDLDSVHLPEAPAMPLVIVTAMSVITDPALAVWTHDERLRRTALLIDVPLGQHLDLWLRHPGSRFRYAVLRIESFGRVVPFLVGTVTGPDNVTSPLMLRPLSHAGVRVHKAALEELYRGTGTAVEDDDVVETDHDLFELFLAHLAGEEVRFGPFIRRHRAR